MWPQIYKFLFLYFNTLGINNYYWYASRKLNYVGPHIKIFKRLFMDFCRHNLKINNICDSLMLEVEHQHAPNF